MNKTYQRVAGARVGRSVFNLSFNKIFDADMGYIYPVWIEEAVPGDIFDIGYQMVIRMQPILAPIMHEIDVFVGYWFAPNRIMWDGSGTDNWETFITGGEDGTATPTLPVWSPGGTAVDSLWDHMEMPIGSDAAGIQPVKFMRSAYNRVWNEYFRDENLQAEVADSNESLLLANWDKDYFTSAAEDQQRGTAVTIPLTGTGSAVWPGASSASQTTMYYNNATSAPYDAGTKAALENNTIDFSTAGTMDVADLRLTVQIQRWMERNQRAGVRYTEFLRSHFAVAPTDSRLDRCEFIGGAKNPIITSEVLQTSEDGTTPQGHMAGHGIGVGSGRIGRYRAQEFGIMLGLMVIKPKPMYHQGVDRRWIKTDKYDYYFPEFAHLSEQPVYQGELYADSVSGNNQTIFGYQGRYNEMRARRSVITGNMRGTFDYWHLCRQFASAPTLNSTFISMSATDPRKDIFASASDRGFIINYGNQIRAVRPLPIEATPGRLDQI